MKKLKSYAECEAFIQADHVVTLLFMDETCPDCALLKPALSALSEALASRIAWVERKDVPIIITHYKVYGVPSIIMFKAQKEVARWVDREPKRCDELIHFITRYL